MSSSACGFRVEDFDPHALPDFDHEFIESAHLQDFARALQTPESSHFVSLNDWKPIYQRVRPRRQNKRQSSKNKRSKDESREGFVYTFSQWPLLIVILGWICVLGGLYWLTRLYVWLYEHMVTWRGHRQGLRKEMSAKTSYDEWIEAAKRLDRHLGNDRWKGTDEYAYYDHSIIAKAKAQLTAELKQLSEIRKSHDSDEACLERLQSVLESCLKYNFVGVENPRLYSETYYGTKDLVQGFIDETHTALSYTLRTSSLQKAAKVQLARRLNANFGKTALCLSGGASFAWYHFGIVKALLDTSLLPKVITGTSGGALVAALVATRTDEELRSLLVPALAYRSMFTHSYEHDRAIHRQALTLNVEPGLGASTLYRVSSLANDFPFHITVNASEEPFSVWFLRWWRTGARFDPVLWAKKCSWFSRGSSTFKEAYDRTGRMLSITCIPSDPHSPTALLNHLTAPDVVIWSSVLASAAVPGILPPIPVMVKKANGSLEPSSFGHRWKDGSLRTDIPLKALNLHFGVTFSIVSQTNPHINAFFYASKGTVGRPVTHRKGRGWRGGYLGSAVETYLKLELQKFLKMIRHLELLPRPFGQDWSSIWLQKFSGTITIWPKSRLSDFYYILSDPPPSRLARMMLAGQQSTWPKILFIENRMKLEKVIEEGLSLGPGESLHQDDILISSTQTLSRRNHEIPQAAPDSVQRQSRRSSLFEEMRRQSGVFFDDVITDGEETESDADGALVNGKDT